MVEVISILAIIELDPMLSTVNSSASSKPLEATQQSTNTNKYNSPPVQSLRSVFDQKLCRNSLSNSNKRWSSLTSETSNESILMLDSKLESLQLLRKKKDSESIKAYLQTGSDIHLLSVKIVEIWSPLAKSCDDNHLAEQLLESLLKVAVLSFQLLAILKRPDIADYGDDDEQVLACAKNLVQSASKAFRDYEAAKIRITQTDYDAARVEMKREIASNVKKSYPLLTKTNAFSSTDSIHSSNQISKIDKFEKSLVPKNPEYINISVPQTLDSYSINQSLQHIVINIPKVMIIQYSPIYLAQLLLSPALKNADSIKRWEPDQIRKDSEADITTSVVLKHDQSTEYSPLINDESLEALSIHDDVFIDKDIDDTPTFMASVSSSIKVDASCQYSPMPENEITAKENKNNCPPQCISKACSPLTDCLKTPELKDCKKKLSIDRAAMESVDEKFNSQWKSDYTSTLNLEFSPLMDDSFLSSFESVTIAEKDNHSPAAFKSPILNLTAVPKFSPLMDVTFLSSFDQPKIEKPKVSNKEEAKKSPALVSEFQSRFFKAYGDHKQIVQQPPTSNKNVEISEITEYNAAPFISPNLKQFSLGWDLNDFQYMNLIQSSLSESIEDPQMNTCSYKTSHVTESSKKPVHEKKTTMNLELPQYDGILPSKWIDDMFISSGIGQCEKQASTVSKLIEKTSQPPKKTMSTEKPQERQPKGKSSPSQWINHLAKNRGAISNSSENTPVDASWIKTIFSESSDSSKIDVKNNTNLPRRPLLSSVAAVSVTPKLKSENDWVQEPKSHSQLGYNQKTSFNSHKPFTTSEKSGSLESNLVMKPTFFNLSNTAINYPQISGALQDVKNQTELGKVRFLNKDIQAFQFRENMASQKRRTSIPKSLNAKKLAVESNLETLKVMHNIPKQNLEFEFGKSSFSNKFAAPPLNRSNTMFLPKGESYANDRHVVKEATFKFNANSRKSRTPPLVNSIFSFSVPRINSTLKRDSSNAFLSLPNNGINSYKEPSKRAKILNEEMESMPSLKRPVSIISDVPMSRNEAMARLKESPSFEKPSSRNLANHSQISHNGKNDNHSRKSRNILFPVRQLSRLKEKKNVSENSSRSEKLEFKSNPSESSSFKSTSTSDNNSDSQFSSSYLTNFETGRPRDKDVYSERTDLRSPPLNSDFELFSHSPILEPAVEKYLNSNSSTASLTHRVKKMDPNQGNAPVTPISRTSSSQMVQEYASKGKSIEQDSEAQIVIPSSASTRAYLEKSASSIVSDSPSPNDEHIYASRNSKDPLERFKKLINYATEDSKDENFEKALKGIQNIIKQLPSVNDDEANLIGNCAIRLLEKCAKKDQACWRYLGNLYSTGLPMVLEPDDRKALQYLLTAERKNDPDCVYRAAVLLETIGSTKELIHYIQKAASQGQPGAMYRLGCAILKGEWGLAKDLEAGVNWIKRSADEATNEYSKGKYGYAILFEKGIENFIPKDHDKMLSLLEEACKLGDPEANFKCALGYESHSWGLVHSMKEAYNQYYRAAIKGHLEAMYRVALFNDSHSEIPKAINQNESTAFKFAFKAASSGHIEAMLLLAGYYLNGVGTDVDREKAKHWHMLHTEAQKKNAANGKKLKIVGGYKDNRCNQM